MKDRSEAEYSEQVRKEAAAAADRALAEVARRYGVDPALVVQWQREKSGEAERERLLQGMAEHTPALLWTADAQGRCIQMSAAGCAFTGRSEQDLLGFGWFQIVHPEDRATTRAVFAAATRGLEPLRLDYRLRRHDGEYRWHSCRAVPVRATGGELRWYGTSVDIHEQKLNEQSLSASQEQTRLARLATNDVLWDWDLSSNHVSWNAAVREHFGCGPADMGSSIDSWYDRIHPDERARVVAGIHAAIDAGRDGWRDEYRFRRADGSYGFFVDRGYISRDDNGRPRRMIGSMLDLTERRSVEEAMRRSEAQFRLLADTMPQFVWTASPDGYHEYFNKRWYDFTGATRQESLGENWARLLHPDDYPRALASWQRSLRTGEPYEIEYRFRRADDGAYHWFLGRALPVRDEEGRIAHWFGTCTEIEELKQAQAALYEADRRKDEFLAMLGHELRNPLAGLAVAAELLERPGLKDAQVAQLREVARRQVRHLSRLVDDLLDVSRITRGVIELRRERMDLREAARRALQTVQAQFDDKRQQIEVRLPEAPVEVLGDPVRLEQVLTNLLSNAGKYTDAEGRIGIELTAEPERAVLRVYDNGIGLEPDALERIFDLFGQGKRALDRAQGGLGIGLTITRNLVELHGGRVQALSAGIGKGSEFVVTLPLAAPAPAAASREVGAAPGGEGRRVLVVDDNPDAISTLALLLEGEGHHVCVARDGPSAIERAREHAPELVLLDIGLPGMDGYEVVRRLRRDPRTRGSVIAALTGYGQAADRERALEAGFDAHFVKPVDTAALRAFVSGSGFRRASASSRRSCHPHRQGRG